MVEGISLQKHDEQFPLLMVAGAGDGGLRNPPPAAVTAVWNTAVPRKRVFYRWPEFVSTCWVTCILLGISFLVFYAIGMVLVYRNRSYIILTCNESRPASDVVYHYVVPRGGKFPLDTFANYLGSVSTQYPDLRFKVYFLIDDSKDNSNPASHSFYGKLKWETSYSEEFNLQNRRDVSEFTSKYTNVKIVVMFLRKYMAMTPLRLSWRTIPIAHLPFYARIVSVWLNGGVGLDLVASNEQFKLGPKHLDWKVNAILKQHNDGISPEKYALTLRKLEREQEETEYVYFFFNMMQRMINETVTMFAKMPLLYEEVNKDSNSTKPDLIQNPGGPLRSKTRFRRSLLQQEVNSSAVNVTDQPNVINIVMPNTSVINVNGIEDQKNRYHILDTNASVISDTVKTTPTTPVTVQGAADFFRHIFGNNKKEKTKPSSLLDKENNSTVEPVKLPSTHETGNNFDGSKVVLFYDISVLSEPPRKNPEPQLLKVSDGNVNSSGSPALSRYVVIEANGGWVAATSGKHPFLAHVLSGGCKQMPPKLAIKNALTVHCSGPFRNEPYCNSIYVLF